MRTRIAVAIIAVTMLPAAARAGEWYEKLKIKGDVRQRHELIRIEDKNDNNRWRIRARLAVEADINEAWSAAIGLASGSDDPVSTNQTLTDGFSTKPLSLDLAYIEFHPKSIEGLLVVAGKMKLPFETTEKTELLWDGDLNPEGFAAKLGRPIGGRANLFLAAGVFYIEDKDPDDESYLAGAQGGFSVKASDKVKVTLGGGYYDYSGAQDMPFFYSASRSYGNSKTVIGSEQIEGEEADVYGYATDFNEVELLGIVSMSLSERTGFKLYGDYVTNVAADSLASGWLLGGAVNRGKDAGGIKVYANYRELEADAVVGAFTDSDFIGGGTNGKGFELGVAYGIAKNMSFDLTYFVNTKGIKDSEDGIDYRRLQADVQVKF